MDERLVAQKAPYTVQAGEAYRWCVCGRSAAQPFRDGSRKPSGLAPLRRVAGRAGPVWFCGCKRTGAEPTCDGGRRAL